MRKILYVILAAMLVFSSNVYAANPITTVPAGTLETTPDKNMFRLSSNGRKYILLDTLEDGYLILAQIPVGVRMFDENMDARFNPSNKDNIAYWLNNDFLNGAYLENGIKEHLVEREWAVEDEIDDEGNKKAVCKIALLSVSEWLKYNKSFGSSEITSVSNYYFLRSRNNATALVAASSPIVTGAKWSQYGIRPCFVVDKDFFNSVRLDLTCLGDCVRKRICDDNTDSQLGEIYSSAELKKLHERYLPQAELVSVSGVPMVGQELTGSYSFLSLSGERENGTCVRWLRADKSNGVYTVIPGADKLTYTISDDDEGKYIKFMVIPQTKDYIGKPVYSKTSSFAIERSDKPVALNVKISGSGNVGERLIVDYNFYDQNLDDEGATRVIFQRSKDNESFEDIAEGYTREYDETYGWRRCNGAKSYTIKKLDCGSYIRAKVVPASVNYPFEGDAVFTDSIYINDEMTLSAEYSDNMLKADANCPGNFGWEYSKDGQKFYVIANSAQYEYTPCVDGYYKFYAENGDKKEETKAVRVDGVSMTYNDAVAMELDGEALFVPKSYAEIYTIEVTAENSEEITIEAEPGYVISKICDGNCIKVFVSAENGIINADKPILKITGNQAIKVSAAGFFDGENIKTAYLLR